MKIVIFLLFIALELFAFEYEPSLEAGIYTTQFSGNIKNPTSKVDFVNDLKYDRSTLSYFEAGLRTNLWYIPTFNLNVINIVENSSSDLNATEMIGNTYNGSTSTDMRYLLVNFKMYKSFYKKMNFTLGKKRRYLGTIEYDLGFNTKYMSYNFHAKDNNNTNTPKDFLDVTQFILLPHVGVRYYYYKFVAYANISAMGFDEVKAYDYSYGVEYRTINRIYVSAGVISESFQATEKRDTITFASKGLKLSVKYIF